MTHRILLLASALGIASFALAQQPDPQPPTIREELVMPPAPPPPQEEPQVFTVVEQMPEFPGGVEAMIAFINTNIRYPEHEKENGVQGRIYVSFVVDQEGKLRDAKVLRGVAGGPGLEREALRVVSIMPNWKPGVQNGKPVSVQYNLPFRFALDR